MKLIEGGISIIVPVFNGTLFIDDAYKNILNQNLDNFEIIFIDNNSIDQSVEKIINLQQIDKRVSCYKATKQGAAAARNKGLAHAKGEFIHFFDVDDQLFEGALIALKEVLNENPEIASVYGNRVNSTCKIVNLIHSTQNSHQVTIHTKPGLGLEWLKNKSKLPGPPSFLHRKITFNTINGFQEDLLIGEDAFFHVRLGNEFDIARLDRDVYHYFRHNNSTVSIQNRKVVDKVFTYWPQIVKAYLPYCNSQLVSNEFKFEVYKQLYGGMGKMIVLAKGLKSRFHLKKKYENEIQPMKIPFVLNLYMHLLVLTGNFNLYKFYFFYVLEPNIKLIYRK